MSEWKKVKFLDVVSLNPRISLEKGVEYPFVEMSNAVPGARKPEKDVYQKYSGGGAKFEEGDTVVARIEPCLQNGKGFQCPYKKGFGSTEFLVFRPMNIKEMDFNFLYYYMGQQSIKEAMAKTMVGASGRQRVNNAVFNDLQINLPPLNIQLDIATILSRYDSLIENYQKQIKLLEEAAQRLYKEWFLDLHFPGHENTKIVDGVPEGWEKKKIEEFAAIKSGFAFKSKDWQGFGCPVVKIKDINGTFVLSGSLDCVPIFVAEKANQYILRTGDLVIAMTGATIGKIGIVTEDDLYANQRVGKFFVKDRFILPFLFCYFKEKSTIDLVLKISSSSAAQPNISGSQLGSFDFMYNKELFDKFCDIVQNPFHKIILLQNQIRLLTEARDRLLPRLMSGDIKV